MTITNLNTKTRLNTTKHWSILLAVAFIAVLSGCGNRSDNPKLENNVLENPEKVSDIAKNTHSDNTSVSENETPSESNNNAPITIDWDEIDSGVDPVPPETFNYPFSKDSEVVTAYAEYFDVSASDAQHSLTVGTASNEPLNDLIDQLGEHYLSHKLTDGANVQLIITTTDNVTPSTHNYVIEGEFARGLILPIAIEPNIEPNTESKTEPN